jgi:hypothetical protein
MALQGLKCEVFGEKKFGIFAECCKGEKWSFFGGKNN